MGRSTLCSAVAGQCESDLALAILRIRLLQLGDEAGYARSPGLLRRCDHQLVQDVITRLGLQCPKSRLGCRLRIQRTLQILRDLSRRLPLVGAIPSAIGLGLVDLCLAAWAHSALGDELLDELGILLGPDRGLVPWSLALQERRLVLAAPLAIDPPAAQGFLQSIGNHQGCGFGGALLGYEQPHTIAGFFVFIQSGSPCVNILEDHRIVIVHGNYCAVWTHSWKASDKYGGGTGPARRLARILPTTRTKKQLTEAELYSRELHAKDLIRLQKISELIDRGVNMAGIGIILELELKTWPCVKTYSADATARRGVTNQADGATIREEEPRVQFGWVEVLRIPRSGLLLMWP